MSGGEGRRVREREEIGCGAPARRARIDRLGSRERDEEIALAIQRERTPKHWPRAWTCTLISTLHPTPCDLSADPAS
jgi:putative endonuclease